METSKTWYFSDFLAYANIARCEGCDLLYPESDLQNIQLDEPGAWAKRCIGCIENLRS